MLGTLPFAFVFRRVVIWVGVVVTLRIDGDRDRDEFWRIALRVLLLLLLTPAFRDTFFDVFVVVFVLLAFAFLIAVFVLFAFVVMESVVEAVGAGLSASISRNRLKKSKMPICVVR